MSQRCLISKRENVRDKDEFYDCIYDEDGSLELLLKDWLNWDKETGIYFGPWKLCIRDKELLENFKKDFENIKYYCPKLFSFDDLWGLYEE